MTITTWFVESVAGVASEDQAVSPGAPDMTTWRGVRRLFL